MSSLQKISTFEISLLLSVDARSLCAPADVLLNDNLVIGADVGASSSKAGLEACCD